MWPCHRPFLAKVIGPWMPFTMPISSYLLTESILRRCLSSNSCKYGMPTLEELMQDPFFTRTHALTNGIASYEDCRIHLKFPIHLKDGLRKAARAIESRLKSDQKLYRNARREVRIQEILGSSEEMKRQKRRLVCYLEIFLQRPD